VFVCDDGKTTRLAADQKRAGFAMRVSRHRP
jgi:hypothetical protein